MRQHRKYDPLVPRALGPKASVWDHDYEERQRRVPVYATQLMLEGRIRFLPRAKDEYARNE